MSVSVTLAVSRDGAPAVSHEALLPLHWTDADVLSELGLPPSSRRVQITRRDASFAEVALGKATASCMRLFISGDRSQVGKSTVCLGLLTALLGRYRPDELAYIKPATQCEQTQLIWKFCADKGIACEGIGPIVFYSGFTRAFLDGTTETSEEMLDKAEAAVAEVSRGKKVCIIDGVGYPAVGSITGTSNADIALRLGAPVLLVGKKGVGDAVDSFNLNHCFFESRGVRVLGAVFNRLPADGYYSLANCRVAIGAYFSQFRPESHLFGFLPELPQLLAGAGGDPAVAPGGSGAQAEGGGDGDGELALSEGERAAVEQLAESFRGHFQLDLLLRDLREREPSESESPQPQPQSQSQAGKAARSSEGEAPGEARAVLEAAAQAQGAAGG